MSAPACLFASEHPLRRRKMSSMQSRSERDTVTAALHIHMCCSMQPDYKQHSACSTLSSPRKCYGVNHHLGGITAICCSHLQLLLLLLSPTSAPSFLAVVDVISSDYTEQSHCTTLQQLTVQDIHAAGNSSASHTHHKPFTLLA